jgi:hypothetical protein
MSQLSAVVNGNSFGHRIVILLLQVISLISLFNFSPYHASRYSHHPIVVNTSLSASLSQPSRLILPISTSFASAAAQLRGRPWQ